MMSEALIVAAVRTPIGKAPLGSLRHTRPDALAAFAIRALLERVPALNPTQIEDVIFGCPHPKANRA
jgi:acetyl-CoA acetyltransferase